MLAETLTALATAGGTAVVQEAGTALWEETRARTARLFGRGDAHRERSELEHLDATAAALAAPGRPDAAAARVQQEIIWQTRFEGLLESVGDAERAALAEQLRALVAQHTTAAAVGRIEITHNTFSGPTAVQVGDGNTQEVTFDRTTE
ncbi:hypothetical protein ACSHWO_36180 (plasmid) [Streptomyces sp. HUAS TT3]|uniref:hypothetical protein n=1 Tax=unclassified Streptomyces TaxID=2593676 RepID=UPI00367B46F5